MLGAFEFPFFIQRLLDLLFTDGRRVPTASGIDQFLQVGAAESVERALGGLWVIRHVLPIFYDQRRPLAWKAAPLLCIHALDIWKWSMLGRCRLALHGLGRECRMPCRIVGLVNQPRTGRHRPGRPPCRTTDIADAIPWVFRALALRNHRAGFRSRSSLAKSRMMRWSARRRSSSHLTCIHSESDSWERALAAFSIDMNFVIAARTS